jgi:hypothetical protein
VLLLLLLLLLLWIWPTASQLCLTLHPRWLLLLSFLVLLLLPRCCIIAATQREHQPSQLPLIQLGQIGPEGWQQLGQE